MGNASEQEIVLLASSAAIKLTAKELKACANKMQKMLPYFCSRQDELWKALFVCYFLSCFTPFPTHFKFVSEEEKLLTSSDPSRRQGGGCEELLDALDQRHCNKMEYRPLRAKHNSKDWGKETGVIYKSRCGRWTQTWKRWRQAQNKMGSDDIYRRLREHVMEHKDEGRAPEKSLAT